MSALPKPIPELEDDCDPLITDAHDLVLLSHVQIYVDLPQLEATLLRARKPATVLKHLAAMAGLVLLVASPAVAQERPSLARPLAAYAAGAALDLHSTYRALHYDGVQELNPMSGWVGRRPVAFVAVAAAEDAALIWALHKWVSPRHPRLFTIGLYTAAVLRTGIAARNYHIHPSRRRL